jgi:hypothetical protein
MKHQVMVSYGDGTSEIFPAFQGSSTNAIKKTFAMIEKKLNAKVVRSLINDKSARVIASDGKILQEITFKTWLIMPRKNVVNNIQERS